MSIVAGSQIAVCLALTRAIGRTQTVEDIYEAALDALSDGLGVSRASILLFDDDGVMRFKAYRNLSETYRRAVEGHTPWRRDSPDPRPIVVADVRQDGSLGSYLPTIEAEGIAAMAFIPLVSRSAVIGKFMLYYGAPHDLTPDELQLAGVIASQVAFAVERTRAEITLRKSEERLRFALDAAAMGTWDWDLTANTVRWSDNLERVHGLPPGTFDGTFASYEREIHPEDQERVLASARRALEEGAPHEVEYRIVAPDGTVRWVEGKGRVELENGRPVRMSGVCMIITRRKEAELARLAAAEEASRLKDEFLATLSHELRTPLHAILGWVQMLQADGLPPDRVRQGLDVIGRNARLQAQLIEDILDVSRIITGKLEIERIPMLVPPLVETAVTAVLPSARAKQIELSVDVQPALPPIEGDPKRLQQVLGNLLSNAIKFTPEHGHVSVWAAAADDEWITIEVTDSGDGIDPAFLPYMFDRFRQADSTSKRKHGGLGLGLSIARHLIDLHRGKIQARSDGPGRGTTVAVRLPAALTPMHLPEAPAAAGAAEGLARLRGLRVLVVDDQTDSRELLAALLERQGAQVVTCDGALAALETLKTGTFHLLVADIAMPGVDGYGLIARARAARQGMPAIAVSAYARIEDRVRALSCGYNDYCAKPVDAAELLAVVQRVIA